MWPFLWQGAAFVLCSTAAFSVPMVILMRIINKQRERQKVSMSSIETAICRKGNEQTA